MGVGDSGEFNIFRDNAEPGNKEPSSSGQYKMFIMDTDAGDNSPPVILIVDDDVLVREALEFTLKKKYKLIICSSGNEGIEKMHPSVSAVILDIKMEGKSGFDTFLEIKKSNPYVPIIFHSAYQDLKSPFEIINDYRPFGYVVKEGDANKLLHTLENAIDYYQQINRNALLVKQLQEKNRILQNLQDGLEVLVEMRTNELNEALNRLSSINSTLHKLSITDGLTGLVNRRHFDILLVEEFNLSEEKRYPLSLLMIDVDNFKNYNDTYGHPAGDLLLKAAAASLQNTLTEPSDVIARYGGEEFVAILPGREKQSAVELAETMRKNIYNLYDNIPGLNCRVTISIGVMTRFPGNSSKPADILSGADSALYRAKQQGKNRVCTFPFD